MRQETGNFGKQKLGSHGHSNSIESAQAMEHVLKNFIEDWQGKFLNEHLQPALELQYDRIRQSFNNKLQL